MKTIADSNGRSHWHSSTYRHQCRIIVLIVCLSNYISVPVLDLYNFHWRFCDFLAAKLAAKSNERHGLARFLWLLTGTPCGGPSLFGDLAGAADRKSIGGDILRNARGGSDKGAVLDVHRRHQGRVAAHKGALPNPGRVLVHAIVVAGNDAGADVSAIADVRIPETGEMVGLALLA